MAPPVLSLPPVSHPAVSDSFVYCLSGLHLHVEPAVGTGHAHSPPSISFPQQTPCLNPWADPRQQECEVDARIPVKPEVAPILEGCVLGSLLTVIY